MGLEEEGKSCCKHIQVCLLNWSIQGWASWTPSMGLEEEGILLRSTSLCTCLTYWPPAGWASRTPPVGLEEEGISHTHHSLCIYLAY